MLKLKTVIPAGILAFGFSNIFAQPDGRDSIILESKTVQPGAHPGGAIDTAAYAYVKGYITNKDSLTGLTLALRERRLFGSSGYLTLAHPRTFDGTVSRLTGTLGGLVTADFSAYNSATPDSFLLEGSFDSLNPASLEPPNAVRKVFWEIKFDTVFGDLSERVIELDSATHRTGKFSGFTTRGPLQIPVHFLKSRITVAPVPPDPRDSMIVESKMLAPNMSGDPAFTVRLSITNKDSLGYLTWVCTEYSLVGSAYALVVKGPGSTGRTFSNLIIPLTNTLRYFASSSFINYNDASPDRFLIGAGFDPADPATIEPPNSVRKPIWELKFKSTSASEGQVVLDTGTINALRNTFTDTRPSDHTVNYLPGVLTIEYLKGDLNGDVMLTAADVAMILTCVFCAACSPPPVGAGACDLNCDGIRSPADVVLELNAVFLTEAFPC